MATLDTAHLGESPGFTNPVLHIAFRALAEEDTPAHRADFYQALLRSVLLIPTDTPVSAALEPRTLTKGEQINLAAYKNELGVITVLAFTDDEAVLAWQPEGSAHVAIRAPDFFRMMAQHAGVEVILNLAGPVRGHLTRDEIKALAESQMPKSSYVVRESIPAGTQVLISAPPKPLPASLRAAFQQALSRYHAIAAAYYFHTYPDKDTLEEPRHVIGLQLAAALEPEARNTLMQTLILDVEDALIGWPKLDFIFVEDPTFIQMLQATVPPFYDPGA